MFYFKTLRVNFSSSEMRGGGGGAGGLSEIFMECEENLLSKDNIFVLLMLAGLHVSFRETR